MVHLKLSQPFPSERVRTFKPDFEFPQIVGMRVVEHLVERVD